MMRIVVITTILFAVVSCATLDTVVKAPKDKGILQEFSGDRETVKSAVLASMSNMDIVIISKEETYYGFVIVFEKTLTGFSWGEVGRVIIPQSNDNRIKVFVHAKKRWVTQVPGTDEREFAEEIFNGTWKILQTGVKT